jgi:hypothetical protein
MRRRTALPKHFPPRRAGNAKCEKAAKLCREAFGAAMRLRIAFSSLPLRVIELFSDFSFLAANVAQMTLEKR